MLESEEVHDLQWRRATVLAPLGTPEGLGRDGEQQGAENAVPVQYLPPSLTKPLLLRAGATAGRTHLLYATGEQLPNDEILSATMGAFVLEKYGIKDIRIVDGGLPGWKAGIEKDGIAG